MQTTESQDVPELTKSRAPKTIGFRLDDEHRKLLLQRARKAGLSPHDMARAYVVQALHNEEHLPAIRESMLQIFNQIQHLQGGLALAAEVLLVAGGKTTDAQARKWVQDNLKPT